VVDLETLATTVRRDGWASGVGDLYSIREKTKTLGWVEVASRRVDRRLRYCVRQRRLLLSRIL
jgi:hypothetical protein